MPTRIQVANEAATPKNAVRVGGPGHIFGCPIRPTPKRDAAKCLELFRRYLEMALKGEPFPELLDGNHINRKQSKRVRRIAEHLHELRGKDLACPCTPDYPCHASVLLEFANVPIGQQPEPVVEDKPKAKRTRKKKADALTR